MRRLRQYWQSLPVRILLAAVVGLLAWLASLYRTEEGPAPGASGGPSYEALYPAEAEAVLKSRSPPPTKP